VSFKVSSLGLTYPGHPIGWLIFQVLKIVLSKSFNTKNCLLLMNIAFT
jgi:hypothetical protein